MYYVSKHFDLCAAHQLSLPYDSPCNKMHGHNYQCSITVKGDKLNSHGMIVDFSALKKAIHSVLDHDTINDVIPGMHPTAENLCAWIAGEVESLIASDPFCPLGSRVHKVVLKETDGNEVVFETEQLD